MAINSRKDVWNVKIQLFGSFELELKVAIVNKAYENQSLNRSPLGVNLRIVSTKIS